MPKFKRIIISYFNGEPKELMKKAGFIWKFSRPVPIADSVEFYCCERRKKGPLPDHFHSVGWSDDGEFPHFTEEQIKECKQWEASTQEVRKSNVVGTYQGADGKEHEIIYLSSSQRGSK